MKVKNKSNLNVILTLASFLSQGPIAPVSLFHSPPAPSAPCPPPPPGPPPVFIDDDDSRPQADGAAVQHSALFTQLNQGMDITKGWSVARPKEDGCKDSSFCI